MRTERHSFLYRRLAFVAGMFHGSDVSSTRALAATKPCSQTLPAQPSARRQSSRPGLTNTGYQLFLLATDEAA